MPHLHHSVSDLTLIRQELTAEQSKQDKGLTLSQRLLLVRKENHFWSDPNLRQNISRATSIPLFLRCSLVTPGLRRKACFFFSLLKQAYNLVVKWVVWSERWSLKIITQKVPKVLLELTLEIWQLSWKEADRQGKGNKQTDKCSDK